MKRTDFNELRRNMRKGLNDVFPLHIILKPFLILCAIYGLGITAIIRANCNYTDDIGRAYAGYRNWLWTSRYINEFLSPIIHTDIFLTDISPLTQLIAVVFIALASVIVIYKFSDKREISFYSVIAAIPIGLSPFFLECLSFKFDSPYMALSVLASVAPLLFLEQKKTIYCGATFIGTLIICTTYQASSGIFPITIMFLLFVQWNKGRSLKELSQIAGVSICGYLSALIFFKLFLMKPIATTQYVSGTLPSLKKIPSIIFQNILQYFKYAFIDFPLLWKILVIVIILSFIYATVSSSTRNKAVAFLFACALLSISSIASYGIYLLLEKPLFYLRALYGWGVFIALMGIVVANTSTPKRLISKVAICYLSWCFLIFAFTFGNTLAEQKQYSFFRIQMVLSDLTRVIDLNGSKKYNVQVSGSTRRTPVVNQISKRNKLLSRLVRSFLQSSGTAFWRYYLFAYPGLPNVKDVTQSNSKKNIDFAKEGLPVLYDSCYHTISSKGDKILIRLK